MTTQPTPPPRGELFSDPGARVAWNAIVALPIDQQHLVLTELQGRLATGFVPGSPQETKIARAIAALREAADILGESPSIKKFEALRNAHPEYGWPPAGTIRTWFGRASWNECLKGAHLVAIPGGDVVVVQNGPAFTRDEACAALCSCAEEFGFPPSWSEYLGWVHRPDVREREGRRPSSQGTFDRVFGGYSNALVEAGLVDGEAGASAIVRRGQVRAATYFISDETIIEGLREIAGVLGRSPRVTEYQRERGRVIEESVAAGAPRTLPSYAAIQHRFGTWDAAIVAAGLEPLGGRGTRSNPREKGVKRAAPQISDDQITDAISEAFAAAGDPFTVDAFKQWRKRTLEQERAAGVRRRIPSHHTIWKRYGSFEAGVKAAGIGTGAGSPITSEGQGS